MAIASEMQVYNCSDCGEDELVCVDTIYNVGLCKKCSDVHKKLKTTNEHIIDISEESLGSIQNESVNRELEKFLPLIQIKQGKCMHEAIRRKFIFEKYNNKTFALESQYKKFESSKGEMSGYLLKKGKNGGKWKYRFFVLKNGVLEYFIDDQTVPKGSLLVSRLNLLISTLENDSYQLTINYFPELSKSRTYYITFTAVSELYNWYYAILAAQSFCAEKFVFETSTCGISGFLYKVGTGRLDRWKKRWVTLNNGHLMYFIDKQSPHPNGEFDIWTKKKGYDIQVGDVHHLVSAPNKHTFRIVTPTRIFKLCAENQMELVAWTDAIKNVIQ